MTEDKKKDQTELWGEMYDKVWERSSASTGETSEITDAVTDLARQHIDFATAQAAILREELQTVRAQIANDLRTRADAVQDGPDVMKRRLFNALKDGAGARSLAAVAYIVVADLIENGNQS